MAKQTEIRILRGSSNYNINTSTHILGDGELFYSKKTNKLYIGDGATQLKYLQGVFIGTEDTTPYTKITFNIINANTEIDLSAAMDNIFSVNWGDGTVTTSPETHSHTYTNVGNYECTVVGATTINSKAFKGNTLITKIIMDDNITLIDDWAFDDCSNLTQVVIGDGVTGIEYAAFQNCSSLTSVIMGSSINIIGQSAFKYCTNLTSIEIPDSVTEIGQGAFDKCSALTSVKIGNNVQKISTFAFQDCNLISIEIPDSVTQMGSNIFYGCDKLESIVLGIGIEEIGSNSLKGFKTVEFKSPTPPKKAYNDWFTFSNFSETKVTVIVPEGSKEDYLDYFPEVDEDGIYVRDHLDITENLSGFAKVAMTGDYNDLINKPTNHITFDEAKITVTGSEVEGDNTVARRYTFKQNNQEVASIDIPKDTVVQSGSVKVVDQANSPYNGAVVGEKYIDLVIANKQSTHIYIPVKDLVDVYTATENATEVQLSISNSNEISAVIVDGAITEDKLDKNLKEKINNSNANVQSDWNEDDESSDAFIKNKPSLAAVATSGSYNDLNSKPTIGNATLTIQKNKTNIDEFSANATENKVINIEVPTKVSELNNDKKFVIQDDIDSSIKTKVLDLLGTSKGIAQLDESGHVPSSQLPSYVDDIIEGYYKEENKCFYKEAEFKTSIDGEASKIYVNLSDNKTYRWGGKTSGYVEISSSLALGETESTAYRGDRGKIAYQHSVTVDGSNPHGTILDNIEDGPTYAKVSKNEKRQYSDLVSKYGDTEPISLKVGTEEVSQLEDYPYEGTTYKAIKVDSTEGDFEVLNSNYETIMAQPISDSQAGKRYYLLGTEDEIDPDEKFYVRKLKGNLLISDIRKLQFDNRESLHEWLRANDNIKKIIRVVVDFQNLRMSMPSITEDGEMNIFTMSDISMTPKQDNNISYTSVFISINYDEVHASSSEILIKPDSSMEYVNANSMTILDNEWTSYGIKFTIIYTV